MRIGILGINHKSSELLFRERLAKACQKRLSCENEIPERLSCVVLSTCNRTEIYFSTEDLAAAQSELLSILREEIQEPFEHKLYTYFGADCFAHLALVTSGWDSVILGETEIQRQVKMAYENTCIYYQLPSCMHYLFQKCLKISKDIRSCVPVSHRQGSLPRMVWQVGQWIFESMVREKVLFIGNSEINRKVLLYFKAKGVDQITVCTRSLASARELERSQNIALIDWSELSRWKEYSLIICGTNFSDYLLSCQDLRQNAKLGPKLIVDLSVPRNVDPALGRHPQITLLNMEEIGRLIEHKQQRDTVAAHRAEELVWEKVHKQVELFHQKETRTMACTQKN